MYIIKADVLDGEEFRVIDDFEGAYLISNFGRVYSTYSDLIMTISDNGAGYKNVGFQINKGIRKWRKQYIHRLVAQTFIPNPDSKKCVNHIDHNKENNCLDNLEWVTAKENTKAGIDAGRINSVKRGKTMQLTHQDRDDIVRLTVDGLGVNEIAVMLGFKRTTVSSVLNGRSGAKQVEWAFDHYRREKIKEINN